MMLLGAVVAVVCCWSCALLPGRATAAVLYPRESATREVNRLDGVWRFKLAPIDDPDKGFADKWFSQDWSEAGLAWSPMPVPASYNDIGVDKALRDHVGWAWYQTHIQAPKSWRNKRVWLYFGSAHYNTAVFVNGQKAMEHSGGHLPFEADIGRLLNFNGRQTLLTVAINNTLTLHTIPQGTLTLKINDTNYPPFYYKNTGNFDFFNYAGIHRSVFLYATEHSFVSDVSVTTLKADPKDSKVRVNVTVSGEFTSCKMSIRDRRNRQVAAIESCAQEVTIHDAKLWWTHDLSDEPGYLYTLEVNVQNGSDTVDVYSVKFGIRTVQVNGTQFLLNGKSFYFTGFGKHEDSDIRGKGLDHALNVKDVTLIRWLGANSFRTSHYPYSEELMDLCDAQGIAVIDETPAVGLENFSDDVRDHHKQVIEELISRDKNRPSVFMWSVANEPESNKAASEDYFKDVVSHAKSLDSSRPVSAALAVSADADHAGQFMDVIMFNKYAAWYSDAGELEVIERQVVNDYSRWFAKHGKPVMVSEYGADTVAGLHATPSWMFSEDFQAELLVKHHRAFDAMRQKGWFIGEHIWNFADFMTAQGTSRVIGNRKGILTRQRQPKAAAKILRCRYHALMATRTTPPQDDSFYCPRTATTTPPHSTLRGQEL